MYKVVATNFSNDWADEEWFMNLYTVFNIPMMGSYMDRAFEHYYSVKLEIEENDRDRPIRAIVFPSEADAVIFMLQYKH